MARKRKVTAPKVRKIEQTKRSWLLWLCALFILLVALSNLALFARNEYAKYKRAPIEAEVKQWEEVVSKTPTYRDGYLKLDTLYWQLEEDDKAKTALDKAREIDPNYSETEKLRDKLGL